MGTPVAPSAGDASPIDVFNVRDFGAVGDGIVDDTAAIQAAIDACNAAMQTDGAQRRVYLPGGDYLVGGITIAKGLVMWGDGSSTTRLYARDPGQTTLSLVAPQGNSGSVDLRDIGFADNGMNATGLRLEGLASDRRVTDVRIQDCLFYQLQTGISMRLAANVWMSGVHAAECDGQHRRHLRRSGS